MRSHPIAGLVVFAALLHAQSGDTQPSVIVRNEAEYSAEATRARVQSMVLLSIVIGEDGKARDVKVAQGAGFGLDEKALEAIGTWVFQPATKDGRPVAVPANIEMNFHMQVHGGKEDHSGQFARLNFPMPAGAVRPELILGMLPANPVSKGDQALRFSLQVDMDGVPKNIAVLGSTDKVWEQQALRVIRAWRFRPASMNGAAVAADGVFELAHSAPPEPEPEPMIVETPGSERTPGAPHALAPIPIAGLKARGNHTATRLANGTVLLAGGVLSGTLPRELASAQTFDPVTRAIANTGSLLAARQGHTATLLKDGRVLIAGGSSGSTPLATAEIFDPSTGSFSATGSMRQARSRHTAILLRDGRVLICGGAGSDGKALAGVEIYDPRVRSFLAAPPMASPRLSPSAVALKDGRVLLAGGAGASAEVFNPESGAFSSVGDLTAARETFSATLLDNGQVLIAGGNSAEIFDPLASAFRATERPPVDLGQPVSILLNNGRVFVTGTHPQTLIYDPDSASFSSGPPVAGLGAGHTATLLEDGSVLMAGSLVPADAGNAELMLVK